MKLAILGTRGIPAEYGGYETFAEELAVRLAQRGHEVTVFCEKGQGNTDKSYKGVRLEYVHAPSLGPLSIVWFDTHCMLRVGGNYDVAYLLGYGAGAFVWVPRIFKTPMWVNMDGLEWKRSKWPWYGRAYLKINEWCAAKFSSGMIADAEGMRLYLRDAYGSGPAIEMISYGADLVDAPPSAALLESFGLTPQNYYLVVCRLEPENHVKEIIKGFNLSNTDKQLIVVGNSDANTPYVREILLTAGEKVRFVGSCYDKQKLQAVRYFAFAYFHGHSVGGTNPSLLEAMGCGNQVIAHDNVFNREVAADAAEYFLSPSDIPAIIESFEKDNAGAAKRSEIAHERIRSIYSWDRIADQYEQLFQPLKF